MGKKKKKNQPAVVTPTQVNGFIRGLKRMPAFVWILATLAAIVVLFGPVAMDVIREQTQYTQSGEAGSGKIIIEDSADLLTADEENLLATHMQPITQYGSVGFVTTKHNSGKAATYAKNKYNQYFGKTDATLFLIDMDNRQIYIQSGGRIYSTVTDAKAETITDNVYKLASRSKYYECASRVFDQIARILAGGLIPEPMKHLSNALLSIVLALLVVFIIANARTRIKNVTEAKVFDESAEKKFKLGEPKRLVVIRETKRRHTESSGGGGGGHYSGGGGGFSGGGGGGGFSSGGGGHGF